MHLPRLLLAAASAAVLLVGCAQAPTGGETPGASAPAPADRAALDSRLQAIDALVNDWRTAPTLEAAHSAAEAAANLVVGPNGPDYGDRDGDGVIGGESTAGILPGRDGTPDGLATPLAGNQCVVNDVLGGDWTEPTVEWDRMLSAIAVWEPANNTMPSLASHPMRIVGWATFTLDSDSLDDAHEYAGHAKLHVDVAARALDC